MSDNGDSQSPITAEAGEPAGLSRDVCALLRILGKGITQLCEHLHDA